MADRRLRVMLAVAFLVAGGVGAYAAATPRVEGTDVSKIASLKLPAPSEVHVLVLPFAVPPSVASGLTATQAERQTEVPRACVLLNLRRQGFAIVPAAAPLSLVPAAADKAVGLEREAKVPGSSDHDKAVAAGKAVGADWVVYGDLVLSMEYATFGLYLRTVKKGVHVNVEVRVVDVASGEVLFWRRMDTSAQGSSMVHGAPANTEDSQIARGLLLKLVSGAFDDLAKALPKHETGPAVTREQLDALMGEMGY